MAFLKRVLNRKKLRSAPNSIEKRTREIPETVAAGDAAESLQRLSQLLDGSAELQTINFGEGNDSGSAAYLQSLVHKHELQQKLAELAQGISSGQLPAVLLPGAMRTQDLSLVIEQLYWGYGAFFFNGDSYCYLYPFELEIQREPAQSETQQSLKGPKDGFVENPQTNLYLIRSKLKDKNLRLRVLTVGARSKSRIFVLYIEDLAQPEVVNSVIHRIKAIDVDIVLDGSVIAQFIQDSWLSPFPQVEYTERPDVIVYSITQGRVAILHDSSPQALLAPTTLFDLLDTPDDYYTNWWLSASIFRLIRLLAVFLATFFPSLYIALVAYNHDFIPTSLALQIAASREGVPFPTPVEAFLLVSIAEIGREAVLRLPNRVVIIIGTAVIAICIMMATAINLISPIMVAVIFFGLICSSVITDYDLQISLRELQFFFMAMASLLGIFGVAMAFFYIAIHLVTLKSFGIPYLSPMAPLNPRDWLHSILRSPAWMLPRLKTYHSQDPNRVAKTVDRKEGKALEKNDR